MRRVVVTGLGMVSPIGNNVQDSWKMALVGESGVGHITLFDVSDYKVRIAAEVKNLDTSASLDAKEARRTTRFCQFACVASYEAMMDSGLDYKNADTSRWGASIGVGLGGLHVIEEGAIEIHEGARKVSPFLLPYVIPNMAAGIVSLKHNLKGPNICPTTACSSGTHGMGEAYLYIKHNMADVMVAGGAEAAISPLGVTCFSSMKALSARNDDPKTASRPFDLERDGFVMGEGSGVVVLEEYEHAKKRGAKIYAELVGYGMSGDAHHITAPAPNGEGGRRCMEMALESGSIPKEQIDYINAHGTSTNMNDHYESAAIGELFGERAGKIAISSTKGVTGHCLGAAGGIEGVFTVMAIKHSLVPPTANYQTPDPNCPLDYTVKGAKEIKVRYGMSNSFGFGGTNATVVFKNLS